MFRKQVNRAGDFFMNLLRKPFSLTTRVMIFFDKYIVLYVKLFTMAIGSKREAAGKSDYDICRPS